MRSFNVLEFRQTPSTVLDPIFQKQSVIQRVCASTHPALLQHLLSAYINKPTSCFQWQTSSGSKIWPMLKMLQRSELSKSPSKSREPGMKKRFQRTQRLHLETPILYLKSVQCVPPPTSTTSHSYGPQEEPERYVNPYVMNYGHLTPEEHQRELDEARRATLPVRWERERREEAEREAKEHWEASQRWQAQVVSAGFISDPNVPVGLPPMGINTDPRPRALPDVHQALRANNPKAPTSQPVIAKKAPPSTGRPLPRAFYREDEPPRICTGTVQPLPQPQLPTATPMTPTYPPRPPLSALPQPVADPRAPLKHPLPQPAQQGPPNKQVRSKAFPPKGADGKPLVTCSTTSTFRS